MISSAPLPNTTLLNASPRPATSSSSQFSSPPAAAPFTTVLSSAQSNYPEAKSPATSKSQNSTSTASNRSKNSTAANSTPPASPSQSSAAATPVPTAAPLPASTPAPAPSGHASGDASSAPAAPPSDSPITTTLAAAELEALALGQSASTQPPTPAGSAATATSSASAAPASTASSTPSPAPSSTPLTAPSSTSPAADAGSSKNAAALQIGADASSPDQSASILLADSSGSDLQSAVHPVAKDPNPVPEIVTGKLAELTARLRTPADPQAATQPVKTNPTDAAPALTPAKSAIAGTSDVISPQLLASITGNAPVSANLDTKKSQTDADEQVVQAVTANLQAAVNDPQSQAVPATPATATGGESSAGGGSNQTSQDSGSQTPAAPASNLTQILAASQSANSSDLNPKTLGTDSAAAVKAAGLTAVSVDQSLRASADAPGQSAWADAGSSAPQSSKESVPAPIPQPPNPAPPPAPLPASLSDVAQASQLYQRVGGAEMHLAMQTDLLGSIDLHAVVHQSTLSATIGVQRADVQSLLANDLPALQHALADQRFHVEQLSVLDTSVGGRLDQSGHQQQQQQNAPAPSGLQVSPPQEFNSTRGEEPLSGWSEAPVFSEYGGQLSIRA